MIQNEYNFKTKLIMWVPLDIFLIKIKADQSCTQINSLLAVDKTKTQFKLIIFYHKHLAPFDKKN